MKKKIIIYLLITVFIFTIGCDKNENNSKYNFDKTYKDTYITYRYPSLLEDSIINGEKNEVIKHTLKTSDGLLLEIEEHLLKDSFSLMENDMQNVENDEGNKDIEKKVKKVNGKSLVRYSFNKDDEYGNDTVYHIYYGIYSYNGINEYIKLSFKNVLSDEDFEQEFLSLFRINK